MWDGTDTCAAVVEGSEKLIEAGGVPYFLRSPEQLSQCFAGLEMVEPGMAPITKWRLDSETVKHIDAYGAVARKP